MLANGLSVFVLVIVVMSGLCGLGVVGGLLLAKHRERKFLRVLNEK